MKNQVPVNNARLHVKEPCGCQLWILLEPTLDKAISSIWMVHCKKCEEWEPLF